MAEKTDKDKLSAVIDKSLALHKPGVLPLERMQQRQITYLKIAKIIRSLKQAENFADKVMIVAPEKERAACWNFEPSLR